MKRLSSIIVATVYLLTLVTQLPHIYSVYAGLERNQRAVFGINTAMGAAVAFEASVALFTWRIINNKLTERSRWTRPGVVGFLVISAVANVSYYFDFAWLDAYAMPAILSVALPVALWLFAEEFGAEAKAAARKAQRSETKAQRVQSRVQQPQPLTFEAQVEAIRAQGLSKGVTAAAIWQLSENGHEGLTSTQVAELAGCSPRTAQMARGKRGG